MRTIEDRFTLNMKDWVKDAELFGDKNIAHTDRYGEIGYPEASAPAVSLLSRAERFMANNYGMPLVPFDMEMTLNYPAFAGDYICRQNYSDENGRTHVEFEHSRDGIVASILLENYDGTNQMGNGRPKLVSYNFGQFIGHFFGHEGRLGAVLGSVNIKFYETPEPSTLDVRLKVDRHDKGGGRIREYLVNGFGNRGSRRIIEIDSAKFVHKVIQ
jgi:hypothetical protein